MKKTLHGASVSSMTVAPSLFVGSSSEARDVAECMVSIIGPSVPCVPWWEAFRPSSFSLPELERLAREHRFALFIASADDVLARRGMVSHATRDNVLGEFFLFVGRNGYERTFLVVDDVAKPARPSDLEGLTVGRYDGRLFQSDPTASVAGACKLIIERVWAVHRQDVERRRAERDRILAIESITAADELAELPFLLRETIDALQGDALRSMADEAQFEKAKGAVTKRIDELGQNRLERARKAGVVAELRALQSSLNGIVLALPFPTELRTGFLHAQDLVKGSMLGLIPELADAIQRKNLLGALELLSTVKGRLTPDDVAEAVVDIVTRKLRDLKDTYAQWWERHSSEVNRSLTKFTRELGRRSNRTAIAALQDGGLG